MSHIKAKQIKLSTKGDLIVGDANGNASILPIGSNNQVLMVENGNVAWKSSSAQYSLSGLNDVSFGTLSDGQILTYDYSNSKWVNISHSFTYNDGVRVSDSKFDDRGGGSAIEVGYNNTSDWSVIQSYDRTNTEWKPLKIRTKTFHVQTNGFDRFNIDENGKIGIGTDTPKTRFDINGLFSSTQRVFNAVTYNVGNGTVTNGFKIKTNIPAGSQVMCSVYINGYDYRATNNIGLNVSFYAYTVSSIVNIRGTSHGSWMPTVELAYEDGFVVIFIGNLPSDGYFNNFHVDLSSPSINVNPQYFTGWTVVDEALTASIKYIVPFTNRFGTIISNGNIYVGPTTSTPTHHRICSDVTEGNPIITIGSATTDMMAIYHAVGTGWNTSASALRIAKNNTTNRSINAAGTVNASGADYAEYLYKSVNCGVIEKGDVVGIDADGNLTDMFDEAHSFVVKSSDPALVGNDTWFKNVGPIPVEPTKPEKPIEPVINEDSEDEEEISRYEREMEQYEQDYQDYEAAMVRYEQDMLDYNEAISDYENRLELERNKVDRIAFSGQVPVNHIGAEVGDYIIPVRNSDGSIGTVSKSENEISFSEYKKAVGKVWKILPDGRAWILVKIG